MAADARPMPATRRRMAGLSFLALLMTLLASLAVPLGSGVRADEVRGGDAEATRARLEELESRIDAIRQTQTQRRSQQGQLQKELRQRELDLAEISRRLTRIEVDQADTRSRIDELQSQTRSLTKAADEQQAAVAAEISNAYKTGGNDQLRLLLSEEDPQELARMLAYYRYILGARRTLIDEYRSTLDTLAALELQLASEEATLEAQRQAVADEQRAQIQARGERATVLADIEQQLDSDAARLVAAEQEREELDALLVEIETALAQLIPEDSVEPFSEARGAMAWPVDGKLTERFGRPRNQGKMRWQGVRLQAPAGSSVNAIHHGRVVYADWLRGAGLLLVIDHGEGYMSLYAHNESLLREVGDWVSAGAAVATVGSSGGQTEPGLYFEIRKDGKPTDPQRWCRG